MTRPMLSGLLFWLCVTLAPALSAADLILLANPPRVVEAESIVESADAVQATMKDGTVRDLPRSEIAHLIPGLTFPEWMKERLAKLPKRDYEGRLEVVIYALVSDHEDAGKREAAFMTRKFPEHDLINVLARRGREALSGDAWIAFRFSEDLEQWLDEEGETTPRYTVSMAAYRDKVAFTKRPGVHGYIILGYHFFETNRGLSPVLLEKDGSYPEGWPSWLKPRWTLEGRLLVQEASPNRFFQRIVAYHFHGTLEISIHATATPEDKIFKYSAARVGKNTDRNEAIFEFASARLYLAVRNDKLFHACPVMQGENPLAAGTPTAEAIDAPEIHAAMPPLFDPEPHYTDPTTWPGREEFEGREEEVEGEEPTTQPTTQPSTQPTTQPAK